MKIKPLWESTLAKAVPAGPLPGQNGHPAGAKVAGLVVTETKRFNKAVFIAPDPVYFYINTAQNALERLDGTLEKLEHGKQPTVFPNETLNSLHTETVYDYLENAMSVIVSLFTGIEAFSNQRIPKIEVYEADPESKRKKPFASKEVFERLATTSYKLRFIAYHQGKGDIRNMNFWKTFEQLSEIRNEITHLKTKTASFFERYKKLYEDLIDADLREIFNSTIQLFLFFDPNFLSYEETDNDSST